MAPMVVNRNGKMEYVDFSEELIEPNTASKVLDRPPEPMTQIPPGLIGMKRSTIASPPENQAYIDRKRFLDIIGNDEVRYQQEAESALSTG